MGRQVVRAQNVSRMCAVCGVDNVQGLHARFLEVEDGELVGVFHPREEHQGYPGRLHGGIATTILDETIGRAINAGEDRDWGVTVELSVRFHKPVPLDRPVHAIGRITSDSRRLFKGTGEIVLEDGTVAVSAQGTYMKLPIDQIAAQDFSSEEWRQDTDPLPDEVDI